MRLSGCTRSSNEGSRLRPCCRRPTPPPCYFGRCSPPAKSICAKLMDGRRSPRSPSISRLTSQPETIPSCYRRSRHTKFQPNPGRHLSAGVKPKMLYGNPRQLTAKGDAEIGLWNISEILEAPEIELVGPLPAEIQNYTVFTSSIPINAKEPAAAKAHLIWISLRVGYPWMVASRPVSQSM